MGPNLAKSWGIKKGQILAQCTMFLRLHHHPMAKKIQICQNLGASKRVKFWLSVQCFCVCTITLRPKKSKFAKILGHQKGSNFPSVHTFFYVCTITLRRKKSKFAKILGHQKGSNFSSVYNFFASAPSPYGEKNPNLPKSWGIKKGQILAQYTLFLCLHHHPTAEKIQIAQNLGASKRVKFWLSIQFFCVCTITLRRKKSKFAKILGHQKGS